jgi:hypothetical protein
MKNESFTAMPLVGVPIFTPACISFAPPLDRPGSFRPTLLGWFSYVDAAYIILRRGQGLPTKKKNSFRETRSQSFEKRPPMPRFGRQNNGSEAKSSLDISHYGIRSFFEPRRPAVKNSNVLKSLQEETDQKRTRMFVRTKKNERNGFFTPSYHLLPSRRSARTGTRLPGLRQKREIAT